MKFKSLIAGIILCISGVIGTSTIANAAEITPKEGMVELTYPSKNLLPIISLYTESAGGGTWDHGITYDSVWSNYLHNGRIHGSTVENSNGQYFSGWKDPGVWSYKKIKASLWGNKAYWKTK